MSEKPVQGMLSLLYHVVYNVDGWQAQFASDTGDPYPVMQAFGLNAQEQKALENVGFSQGEQRDKEEEELIRRCLFPELEKFYATLKPYQGNGNGTAVAEKPIKKMLSFLYCIGYVDQWREKFTASKESADAVMAAFDLEPKEQELIRAIREDNTGQPGDKLQALAGVIVEEVKKELQWHDTEAW